MELQLESFNKFWKEHKRSKDSIEKKLDRGQDVSRQEAERLQGQFEACTSSFERALKALKVKDEAKQRSEFEDFSKKFETTTSATLTSATSYGEKQKPKNLDELEETVDDIPETGSPKLFSTSDEAETEAARIELLLEKLDDLMTSLRALETRPKIDQMEKLVNVQRTIKTKENLLKIDLKNSKIGAKILSDFESDFEDLERDGRNFETLLKLSGDLPTKFLQVIYYLLN